MENDVPFLFQGRFAISDVELLLKGHKIWVVCFPVRHDSEGI